MLESLVNYLGIIVLIAIVKRIFLWIFAFSPFEKKDIAKQLPKGSYVVITGGSYGMGLEYGLELAKKGFNLVLIARNKQKLEDAAKEIKKVANVEIILISFDLFSTDGKSYEQLAQKISGLDISLLINNAGQTYCEHFHHSDFNAIESVMKVNFMGPIFLTRALLPLLKESVKKHKVGIITVSSTAAINPIPYFQVYSATKIGLEAFHNALAVENPEFLYLIVRPHFVETRMTFNKKTIESVSASANVKGALAEFGRLGLSYGHWKHMIIGFIYELPPYSLFSVCAKAMGKDWLKMHKEETSKGFTLN